MVATGISSQTISDTSDPDTRSRAALRLALLAGVACVCLTWIASGNSATVSDPSSAAELPSSDTAQQLQESLLTEVDLLSESGIWTFAGLNWAISQTEPKPLPHDLSASVPAAVDEEVNQIDQHLLRLIQSLMVVRSQTMNRTEYRMASDELRATAVTVGSGPRETPVSIRIWWPAAPGYWKEVRAIRLSNRPATDSESGFPFAHRLIATRSGDQGNVQCYLLHTELEFSKLKQQFQANGWTVDSPPSGADLPKMFRVRKQSTIFDVSVQSNTNRFGRTLMIRRIR